jgi:hypothetical protein
LPLSQTNSVQDSATLSVQLIPIYGMSIPVIIRSGEVDVKAALSDLKLETQTGSQQNLKLTIHRTGNISIYGDIIVQFIPAGGKPYEIGAIKGLGVYTNIDKRNVTVKLDNTSGKAMSKGKLKVQYISNGNSKPVIYAEGELGIE